MPFPRPTLTQLVNQDAADFSTNLPGADALLRFSVVGVFGRVIAGLVNLFFGYLDYIAKQSTPFTAIGEALAGWGGLKAIVLEDAAKATGTLTFTGAEDRPLAAGVPVIRGDNVAYVTTGSGTVGVGLTVTVPAIAVAAGAAGNCDEGVGMTLGASVAGVNSSGVAASAFTGGVDIETQDSFRGRILQAFANPPQGGDAEDYVTWALQLAGVTRAWPVPLENGAGTASVYFMMDAAEADHAGFPQGSNGVASHETRDAPATGDQLALANHLYPLRPVTALVYAKAPTANPVAFTITGLTGLAALQASVESAIAQVMLVSGSPGGTVDPSGAANPPVDLSAIEAAIAAIAGTAGFVITAVSCPHGAVSPGSDGNITPNAGYLSTLGVVTFP
jgi:uncharacterized phage protein gp47/JayE